MQFDQAIREYRDQHGRSLLEHSQEAPTLVVFLRHSGCTFCREALADLQERRSAIEDEGRRIGLVHMTTDSDAAAFFGKYGMDDVPRFADPDRELYDAFGLRRGNLLQLFGPTVWVRGLMATLRGHSVGKLAGDGFQMPGVFLLHDGAIREAYRHRTAGDRPDYVGIACSA